MTRGVATGEGEQLVGKVLAMIGRALTAGDKPKDSFGGDWVRLPQAVLDHLEIAQNNGQQIIEIMGDTAGELADRIKLLRMAQRFLGTRALGAFGDELPVLFRQFARSIRDPFLEQLVERTQLDFGVAHTQEGVDHRAKLLRVDRLDEK